MVVSKSKEFREICKKLRAAGSFAWDTEFVQDRTYWPRLCLIQIAAGDLVAAIDPFAVGELTPFWELIVDPDVEVIVHAGEQDLKIAYDASGLVPRNIFDTQIAAGFAGYGDSVSYAGLLQRKLGVHVGKRETLTDWARRPLANAQIEYALDDVRHLEEVSERLCAKLEKLGRLAWVAEDLRFYEEEETYRRDPRMAWVRLAKRRSLDRTTLAVLRELAAWREEEAARRDVPRNRVLSDDLLLTIARRGSRKLADLSAVRNLRERIVAESGEEILARIAKGRAVPADERPRPPARPSEDPVRARLSDLMDLFVQLRAKELGIGRNILATRLDLERLAAAHLAGARGEKEPAIAHGWRAELVGNALRDLLDGRIALRVNPATRALEVFAP